MRLRYVISSSDVQGFAWNVSSNIYQGPLRKVYPVSVFKSKDFCAPRTLIMLAISLAFVLFESS